MQWSLGKREAFTVEEQQDARVCVCKKKMLTHSQNLIFTKAIPILMKLSDTCIFDSDAQVWRISDNVLKQNDTFLYILKEQRHQKTFDG